MRGVYVSPNRDTSNSVVYMTIEQLGPSGYRLLSHWPHEEHRPEDMVNVGGRVGMRLPGVFVAPKEVERPIRT